MVGKQKGSLNLRLGCVAQGSNSLALLRIRKWPISYTMTVTQLAPIQAPYHNNLQVSFKVNPVLIPIGLWKTRTILEANQEFSDKYGRIGNISDRKSGLKNHTP